MDESRKQIERAHALVEARARRVQDFPEPGVEFLDLTPVLADSEAFGAVIDALGLGWDGIDLVAGLDARGFLLGAAVARELGLGVLAIRKAGKLPPPVHSRTYSLEYGEATLEIPAEGVDLRGRRILIVDDVLATGGTVGASIDLLEECGAEIAGVSVVLEVPGLGGRDKLSSTTVRSLSES